jgi:protease-4
MLLGEIMGSETITKAIRTMREDKSVKALILRVDSPGGVMAASDLIRREIELTRKEKPVIVSMGGVAASGGYHISCPAGKILADEATVTGSIGVFNLWFHTRGLYQKLGVNKEIFTRGKHADPMPSWRDVTEEDMNLMQYFVDQYYAKFVGDVAKGRGMKADSINSIAQGRVWSGKAALQNGLVDGIGGLTVAIRAARDEAGIPADEEVEFRVLPGHGGFLERLAAGASARVVGRVEIPENLRDLLEDGAYLSAFDEPFLYLAPYTLDIK